jgi:ABC-type amino acid transport substrate-binding protein
MKVLLFISIFLSLEVLAEKKIVFYRQNSSPKYFSEADGRLGLCDEIYLVFKKRLENLDFKVEITNELYPIKRILQGLDERKFALFCGAGKNAERIKKFQYSKTPVYYVSNVVASHISENFIPQDFNDLSKEGIVVGAYHGTSSAKFLRSHNGIVVNDRIYNFKDAFRLISSKTKLRYFYYHDLGLNFLIKESPHKLKVLPTKFRTVPQWILYSKSIPKEIFNVIDNEFTKMTNSKEFKTIQKKYFPN